MDNNFLSKETIQNILSEKTNSGVPRLDRIRDNNPTLFEELGNPDKPTESVAEDLIEWSIFLENKLNNNFNCFLCELNNYSKLIDLLINSLDNLDLVIPCVIAFSYPNLSITLKQVSVNSKLRNRINNLKYICMHYQRTDLNIETKKWLYEKIIDEVFSQKYFLYKFNKNIEDFKGEYLPLGLLLYDIPSEDDERLDFIKNFENGTI